MIGRYAARFDAQGEPDLIRALTRRALIATSVLATGLTLLMLTVVTVLRHELRIGSVWAIGLTALLTLPSAATPLFWGLAQGLQRFGLLAVAMIAGTAMRLVALVALVVVGVDVAGVVLATFVGSIVAVAVPWLPLRRWLTAPSHAVASVDSRVVASVLAPVMVGTLAITSLTTVDVIVAKLAFGDTEAGVYGSASLVGRIILYLPAAIVTVPLPKVSARQPSLATPRTYSA